MDVEGSSKYPVQISSEILRLCVETTVFMWVFWLWSFGCDTMWSTGWYWCLRGTCCTILLIPFLLRICTKWSHNPKDHGLDISMFGNMIEIWNRYFLNVIEVPDNGLGLKINFERSCNVGFWENWTAVETRFVNIPFVSWNKS